MRSGTYMAVLTSAFISGMMVLFGRNVLSLFVSGEPDQTRQVLDIAYKYLFIMAVFLWVLYLLYVYAEICAWSSAAVLLFVSYMIIIRKYKEVTVHT